MATTDNVESRIVRLALGVIKVDHALQPRLAMDEDHWKRMAEAYIEGEDIPPPVHVFWDGKHYWLVDGFHRWTAMWSLRHLKPVNKFVEIRCIVHAGSKQEAIVYAAQANLDNRSKPMSELDRKKAFFMLMGLESYRSNSDNSLGKLIGVSGRTAKSYRVEYCDKNGLNLPETIIGLGGKKHPYNRRNPGSMTLPAIVKRPGSKGSSAGFKGKKIALPNDHDKAVAQLSKLIEREEYDMKRYENQDDVSNILTSLGFHLIPVFGDGFWQFQRWGVSGYLVQEAVMTSVAPRPVGDCAVVHDSYRHRTNFSNAIGRVLLCRAHVGCSRAVVLCRVQEIPEDILDLGRQTGVEFLTYEDFAASLKGNSPLPDPEVF